MTSLRHMIYDLQGVETDSPHHPERDQFSHTVQVTLCAVGKLPLLSPFHGRILLKAAILHDVGKATTIRERGNMHGHEKHSADMVRDQVEPEVVWLIENHIRIIHMDEMRKSKQEALTTHPLFPILKLLRECDVGGRNANFHITLAVEKLFDGILKSVEI